MNLILFDFNFLPPITIPILQPIDQQVISNINFFYTKSLFQKCFDITNDTELILREFWNFNFILIINFLILSPINLIDSAWYQMSY